MSQPTNEPNHIDWLNPSTPNLTNPERDERETTPEEQMEAQKALETLADVPTSEGPPAPQGPDPDKEYLHKFIGRCERYLRNMTALEVARDAGYILPEFTIRVASDFLSHTYGSLELYGATVRERIYQNRQITEPYRKALIRLEKTGAIFGDERVAVTHILRLAALQEFFPMLAHEE